jgi:hypothetical protein
MTKIPAILSATLTATLAACADDHTPVGQPVTTSLVASDSSSVGVVSVFNSTDGLFITATPAPGWELSETRLSVSAKLSGIPQSKAGGPNLDRFLLRKKKTTPSGEMTYGLPLLVEPGTTIFIALYAELNQTPTGSKTASRENADCDPNDKTTAWAQGTPFDGKAGAMYLTYTVKAAAPPTLAGRYRTHSQESWGGATADSSAAIYLSAKFFDAFPRGVPIGVSSGFYAQFTTAQAVSDFLPQMGSPAPLDRRSVNPLDLANPFAGAALALALNVGFDAADPSFSAADLPLSALVIADPKSALYGLAVGDVLTLANSHLAGRAGASDPSLGDVYDAVLRININFEGGTFERGFLGLP